MSEVKIPEGYKQTEVGVIPKDWEITTIGDFAPLQRGFDLPTTKVEAGDYPVVYSNGIVRNHKDFQVKGAGIVTGRSGTIGKVHYIESDFWPHNTTLWVTSFGDAHVKFVYYLFKYIGFERFKSGSGVPTLNRNDAHSFKITVPTKVDEQTAIATALSDIDNLIQSLEKLIAKKEAIKTGTMQQLLTGKTRLPEFATRDDGSKKGFKQTELGRIPDDWEVIEFGKLLKEFRNGYSFSAKGYIKNGTPIITMSQIGLNGSFQYNPNEVKKWDASQFEHLKDFWVKDGDLLIAMTDVTPDKNLIGQMTIAELTHTALLNQRVGLLRLNKDLAQSNYLRYLSSLPLWRTYCKGVASLGVQANIGTKEIKQASVTLPLIEEQTAIATILSDMDTQIQALQQRLEKTRDIKQGMMQQLLTGKVRLAH